QPGARREEGSEAIPVAPSGRSGDDVVDGEDGGVDVLLLGRWRRRLGGRAGGAEKERGGIGKLHAAEFTSTTPAAASPRPALCRRARALCESRRRARAPRSRAHGSASSSTGGLVRVRHWRDAGTGTRS